MDPADKIADAGFYIGSANRREGYWTVRIYSEWEADHETYFNGTGATLNEALEKALHKWTGNTIRSCSCGNGPINDNQTMCLCCRFGHKAFIQQEDDNWRSAGVYCTRCLKSLPDPQKSEK